MSNIGASPVLEALKGFKVSCRCGCGRTGSPLALRWTKWGQHGYVTEECWRKAIKEYNDRKASTKEDKTHV